MSKRVLGVIGGSGLYEIEGLKIEEEKKLSTPFGEPSDSYIIGKLEGTKIVFLPRHGKGHRILPHLLNYRANIYGMKMLGVDSIIAVSAVGSMKEEIKPGDIVIPDQLIDRTKSRISTFFENGIAGHIGFADPFCNSLSEVLYKGAKDSKATIHKGGTYLCIEGPQFSTRAESNLYRKWGVDIIGMTNLPEAKLAREAEICYATLALATDYDCWHETEEDVNVEMVVQTLLKNVSLAKEIIKNSIRYIEEKKDCLCGQALKYAIITDKNVIPEDVKERLSLIIGKYLDRKD